MVPETSEGILLKQMRKPGGEAGKSPCPRERMKWMRAYGEREHHGKYVLDDYTFSRNHRKAVTIRRWKRNLKRKARKYNRLRLD